jgi:hypothetical protein
MGSVTQICGIILALFAQAHARDNGGRWSRYGGDGYSDIDQIVAHKRDWDLVHREGGGGWDIPKKSLLADWNKRSDNPKAASYKKAALERIARSWSTRGQKNVFRQGGYDNYDDEDDYDYYEPAKPNNFVDGTHADSLGQRERAAEAWAEAAEEAAAGAQTATAAAEGPKMSPSPSVELSSLATGLPGPWAVALISMFFGSGVTFAMLRFRHAALTTSEEPLLAE